MRVEIYTVIKNAEYILPLYLKHYKRAFPGCVINVFDNNSEDKSIVLCKEAGCVIKNFPVYTEENLQYFKNNIWKNSTADWIIVCDVDELIQITQEELEKLDVDIVQFEGYNMVDVGNVVDPELMDHGVKSKPYNKCCLFKRNIKEINYAIGAHDCSPGKGLRYSVGEYKLLHYNRSWFSEEEFEKKHGHINKSIYKQLVKDVIRIR